MRKIKEVLRLRFELGLGQRQIVRSCGIGLSTVHDYLERAVRAGIGRPLCEALGEEELEAKLFGNAPVVMRVVQRPQPDWKALHEQLQQHRHLTLQLLWEEYRQAHPDGYRYSWFCERYQQWRRHLDVVLRQEHKAGEKMFVDWAGATIPVYDTSTGEAWPAFLFVAVLGRYNLQRQVVEAENLSRHLSRKMQDRSLVAFMSGRCARAAILGYVNADRKSTGANVIPHQEQAPLWVEAFLMLRTRNYTQEQVRQTMNSKGLRDRKGKPVSAQTFNKSIRNPFYCGWMVSEKHSKRARGLHQPLISEELFEEVQRFLRGEKPATASKRKLNEALPLKNFVRCAVCGTKLTGGIVKKKNGSAYGYYWCRKAGCRAVKSISSVLMESDFTQLLKLLRPMEDTLLSFPKIAADLWAETQGNVEKQRNRLTAQLNEAKAQKAALLKMRLNGELEPEEFKEANADYSRQVDTLSEELQTLESVSAQQEAFIRFVKVRLMDIVKAWENAPVENRYIVQTLFFSDGLTYDPNSNSLNSAKSTLFNTLTQVEASIYQDGVPDGI